MKRVWIGLILFYQRWISPYKGFRCAHGKLHKGLTCSEAVKRIIEEHGLWGGRHRIRKRFRECRFAYYVLKSRPHLATTAGPLMMVAPDDKPPVRPEYAGAIDTAQPANPSAPSKNDSSNQDNQDKPQSYFKSKKSDECGDCLCFPVVAPCDAGCAGVDCDVCPCDLPF